MPENLDITPLVGELRTLNSSVQKLTEIQKEIKAKQHELAALGRQQADLAQQQAQLQKQLLSSQLADLEIQKQSLLIQEKQLNEQRQQTINTSIIAANSQIETLLRQQEEERRKRQQFLKNTIFAVEEVAGAVLAQQDNLMVFLMLHKLTMVVSNYDVFPDEFEEINDKKYASAVLKTLEQNLQRTTSSLTPQDQEDIKTWQETPGLLEERKAEIASAKQRCQSVSERLLSSQRHLELLRPKLAPDPRKLRVITLASRYFFAIAMLSLLASALTAGLDLALWPQIGIFGFLITLLLSVALMILRSRMDVEGRRQRVGNQIQTYEKELKQLSEWIPQAEAEERRFSEKLEETLTRHSGLRTFPRNLSA
jgi:chromosome segregation ATPase